MKFALATCVFALVAACGMATIAVAQSDQYGYGDVSGYASGLTRDLLLGPEWRAYESPQVPTAYELARPATSRTATALRPIPSPSTTTAAPMLKQTDYALRFFGGDSARETLQQMPQRPTSGPASVPGVSSRLQKPFQHASNGQTVSPYLNLDRPESAIDLPNYNTFVVPQFEQQGVNRRQQRELQRLQRQVQTASYRNVGSSRAATPTTGHGTRFGDTGQYYNGWRR